VHFVANVFGTLWVGVILFFTLSGFLISWPFWKRKAARNATLIPPGYSWRRFWKIYPPLALAIVLLTPVYIFWKGHTTVFVHTALQWLAGLAFLMPVNGKLNPAMWSLVVEVHFYLVLPLLFVLTKRFSARTCLWLISLSLLIVPCSIRIATGLAPTFSPEISDPFLTGLSSFAIGVALAGIDNLNLWHGGWSRIAHAGWGVLLLGLLGLALVRMHPPGHSDWLGQGFNSVIVIGTGCLLCYAANPRNPVAKLLCAPWLRWCGVISYEWYLFHQPMVFLSRDFLGPAGGSLVRYCVILAVPLLFSLGVAALVYRKFSLPILKYGRSRKAVRK